jgi:hypothetical protein
MIPGPLIPQHGVGRGAPQRLGKVRNRALVVVQLAEAKAPLLVGIGGRGVQLKGPLGKSNKLPFC